MAITLVHAQYISLTINIFAFWNGYSLLGKESAIIVVRHEANLLALCFLAQCLKTVVKSNLPNLRLGQSTQRKYRVAEVLLGEHPEEIGLVLVGIYCRLEIHVSAVFGNLRIVPCGNIIAAILLGSLHEFAPLNVRIA